MVRQARLIAVVVATFLMWCAVLLVGCEGVRSQAPREVQERSEATNQWQATSSEETASEGVARCEGTRTYKLPFHKAMEVQGYGFPGTYTTRASVTVVGL